MSEFTNDNSKILLQNLKERMVHEICIIVNGSLVNKEITYIKNTCIIDIDEPLYKDDDIKIVIRNRLFTEGRKNKFLYWICVLAGIIGQSAGEGFIGNPFELIAEFKFQRNIELYFNDKLTNHPFCTNVSSAMLTSWISCDDAVFRSWKIALILLVNLMALFVSLLIVLVNLEETLLAISCIILTCNIILYCILSRYNKYMLLCHK